jgi:hypothetical protein
MKVSVTRASENTYEIVFGDQSVSVSINDLKLLLLEVTRVLAPSGGIKKSNTVQASDLIDRLKLTDDVSVQKFIVAMGEVDILIYLKYAEEDAVLLKKFYDNMSELSRKMHAEDIAYKFQNGIPAGQLDDTVSRLVRME